jgi:hypothetical protein
MRVLCGAISLVTALVARSAWATSPPAVARLDVYQEPSGTVRVCENLPIRGCPDQGVLREDASTGEVVKLGNCVDGCWVDECVPAGTYRYGLLDPYDCVGYAQYYTEVTVAGAAEGCTRTLPEPEPASGVPWRAGQRWVCGPPGTPGGGASCGADPGRPIHATNLLLLAAALALVRWRSIVRRPTGP